MTTYGRVSLAPHVGGRPFETKSGVIDAAYVRNVMGRTPTSANIGGAKRHWRGMGDESHSGATEDVEPSGTARSNQDHLKSKKTEEHEETHEKAPENYKHSEQNINRTTTQTVNTNPVAAGINATANLVSAGADFTDSIDKALNSAQERRIKIAEKTEGFLADIAKNTGKREDEVTRKYQELRHKRSMSEKNFRPATLSMAEFGLDLGDVLAAEKKNGPPALKAKLREADKALDEYVRKSMGIDANGHNASERAKLKRMAQEAAAAETELRIIAERAKKGGYDIDIDAILANNKDIETGSGRRSGGSRRPVVRSGTGDILPKSDLIKRLYPNPDMMSGLRFC